MQSRILAKKNGEEIFQNYMKNRMVRFSQPGQQDKHKLWGLVTRIFSEHP